MRTAKVLAVLLTALVPGAGHLVRREYLRAAALLLAFVLLVDGIVVGRMLIAPDSPERGRRIATWSSVGAAGVWLLAMGHIVYVSFLFDEEAHRRRVEVLFCGGQQDYLRGDHEAAAAAFRQVVKLDPEDPDARLYLAAAYRALGRFWRARRQLRKCRSVDVSGKWAWEIAQAMAAMRRR